ncbi:hypothetical protein ACFQE8_02500 [Salinirubellus sp. GCM10025818]|jgi:hypothetical protein|uniref:hypothetical protein n=1 Tax=Salinirubellus TaxID=2162630 RepID=UPI0030D051F6
MAQTLILSTLLTGALVLAVVLVAVRWIDWQAYTPDAPGGRDLVSRAAGNQSVWIAGFLLLLVVFGGGAVVFVAGGLPEETVNAIGLVLGVATAAVVGGYLFYGTYASARGRGRPSSVAVAEGSTLVGTLFLLVITAKLVFLT